MPRLSLFAPCERVLQGSDLSTSILGLLQGTTITATIARPVHQTPALDAPRVVAAPIKWAVFAMWIREDQDAGKEFTGVVRVIHPDGKTQLMEERFPFKMNKEIHNTIMNADRFPLSDEGKYEITLSLVADGRERALGSAYLYVAHQLAEKMSLPSGDITPSPSEPTSKP